MLYPQPVRNFQKNGVAGRFHVQGTDVPRFPSDQPRPMLLDMPQSSTMAGSVQLPDECHHRRHITRASCRDKMQGLGNPSIYCHESSKRPPVFLLNLVPRRRHSLSIVCASHCVSGFEALCRRNLRICSGVICRRINLPLRGSRVRKYISARSPLYSE